MIYVLLLEQSKIYVGFSDRPVGERFLEHFNHFGSKWTAIYRPLQVLRVLEGGRKEENEMTLKMMDIYGWWNVRGGSWCQVEMDSCPPALMEFQRLNIPTELTQGKLHACKRCGRDSHSIQQCYAKTTVSGKIIDDSESESSDSSETCFRCGRTSHWANDCYAKTDVQGNPLNK
jgi:ribosomal protein L37E